MRHVRSPGPVVALLAVVAVAGCARMLPGGGPSAAGPQPSAAEVPSVAASPTPCPIGGGAFSYGYGSFAEFAAMTDGVAVVRIVSVGEVQYSTDDGRRPSCADVAAADDAFGVGRVVQVEMVEVVRGTWPAPGPVASYWLPGGAIGGDVSPEAGFDLPAPTTGALAVAFLLAQPIDFDDGQGTLAVHIGELFPVDDAGRVVTPDPSELILIDQMEKVLRAE